MQSTPHLRLGLWQAAGTPGDVAANMAEIARVARGAKGTLDLLVFPECFLTGYYSELPVGPVAAEVTPGVIADLAGLSAETAVALIVGSYEALPDGTANSAFVFAPEQGHVGTYRKQMPYGAWEKRTFQRGRSSFIFDYNGFRIGVLICYDVEFPECGRALARQGADLIAVPTAAMVPFDSVGRITVPARAIENHCFVGYANRIGHDAAHTYLGESCIVAPDGAVLARADGSKGLVTADLDRARRDAAREAFDYLDDLDAADWLT